MLAMSRPRLGLSLFIFNIVLIFILSEIARVPSRARAGDRSGNPGVPWPATDGLGRTVPVRPEAGPTRPDRFVGIFYFLWLNERHNRGALGHGPYDVARILAADPEA